MTNSRTICKQGHLGPFRSDNHSCVMCNKIRAQNYAKDHPDSAKQHSVQKYNISLEYYKWLKSHYTSCQICNRPFEGTSKCRFALDHCHTTGNLRGVLCHQCNAALGMVKDSVSTLQRMIEYLSVPQQFASPPEGIDILPPGPTKGSKKHNAKLTEDFVRKLKRGEIKPSRKLAKEMGLSGIAMFYRILNGEIWKHIE